MSAYRENFRPAPPPSRLSAWHPWRAVLVWILIVLGGAGMAYAFIQAILHGNPRAVILPIASASVVATPLPPLAPLDTQQLTDARVEGFRAGLAEGLGQGCAQPQRLALPIATR